MMRTAGLLVLALLLIPSLGSAGFIEYPGTDRDGTPFTLTVFTTHFTIFGSTSSVLPICEPAACYTLTGDSQEPAIIAIRNAWIALLLQARTTGQKVRVHWSDTDEHARQFALCGLEGCIYAVEAPSPVEAPDQ